MSYVISSAEACNVEESFCQQQRQISVRKKAVLDLRSRAFYQLIIIAFHQDDHCIPLSFNHADVAHDSLGLSPSTFLHDLRNGYASSGHSLCGADASAVAAPAGIAPFVDFKSLRFTRSLPGTTINIFKAGCAHGDFRHSGDTVRTMDRKKDNSDRFASQTRRGDPFAKPAGRFRTEGLHNAT